MVLFGYLAALTAATCWAFTSLLAVEPVRRLGPIAFNTLRMGIVGLMLSAGLVFTNRWYWPGMEAVGVLMASGFVGIFLGDTLLFVALKTLGPRLTGLLFATNAPISFLLGIVLLDEGYGWLNLFGVLAVTTGVFLAIAARSQSGSHRWEQAHGHVGLGIAAGFGAALCQSLGTVMVFNLMRAGQDPLFATMIRVWIGFACLLPLLIAWPRLTGGLSRLQALTLRHLGQIVASGGLGIAVGMSLILWAVDQAPLGTVAVLSATTPVMLLPLLWLTTGERPKLRSMLAAAIVVGGTALIFLAE